MSWTAAQRHDWRVRNLILVAGVLSILVGSIWSYVYFRLGNLWNLSFTAMVVVGGGIMLALVFYGHQRVSMIFFAHLVFVTVILCGLADVPVDGVPRSIHMNLLPVAAAALLAFSSEGFYLRLFLPITSLVVFVAFQVELIPALQMDDLTGVSAGWPGVWANNITGIGSTCVAIAIMQANMTLRRSLEGELRQAVARGEFHLHYQPQMDHTARMIGAEALLRWRHPTRGHVSPGEFIPLAEETGLIIPIGEWVLRTACAQLQVWAKDPATAHLTIAVNVSASQFRQPDFVEQVRSILALSGAPASRLKLELTESALADDVATVVAKMTALKGTGISWSLDDFGTGYSSLSSLKRLPLDQLKIDQSFVRDLQTDPRNMPIVEAILHLSETLHLVVIAEGVETEAQLAALTSAGCRYFQGFYFSRPLPIAELEQFHRLTA
ncbi:putative bifunctional diguanylate cyclase/phosphodiesterase [Affinirhizobium pseudoryzae]|uniref:putative bifunctional diguanylate cyclase/phosphodiesterase n=1 Tax=Allorhizobium pseudoryzae TaxID=379684 RepID=UPI0013ED7BD8|nr:EAL domain-containing protein [Allorhizobium pseudoryzae]